MRICEHAYGCVELAAHRVTTWRLTQLLCTMHKDAVVALSLAQGAPFPEIEDLEDIEISSATRCMALRDGRPGPRPSRSAQVEKPT